ncbi:MAG: GNAT family N-acetyltransferase [Pseudomonadota bacterium]
MAASDGAETYTVTFLEMTAPPRGAPPPRPAEPLALMAAPEPPLHFFMYLYRTVGADYQWTDLLAWEPERLAAFVQDPLVRLTVLYRAGAPAGFFQLDRRQQGACDLAYFGLTPEALGRGIGPWLLWTALQDAWATAPDPLPPEPVERVTVNTCTLDHRSALALYQRMGFAPIRREERRLGEPVWPRPR